MPSLIEGYEYDIFISYRQKDNKHDGWVTRFVENLKGELESTFKEEISVYFDINPHDGLLETHDVADSLKDKLKCLIFIPILSRTYCDPKCFAWEHEFKTFIEQSSHDQFGLKVKLPNGNVASRVLPVIIHDLDVDDVRECESVLGGVLRGIEFIYKEPGIDKPLSPEDDEKKNLNKSKYNIQVVKAGHAIKEIIDGMLMRGNNQEGLNEKVTAPTAGKKFGTKGKFIAGSVLVLALILIGIFLFSGRFKSGDTSEKSIAVLPFYNYSDNADQEYMSDGLTDEIINHLYKIKSFDKVVSLSSVLTYKNTDKKLPQIADDLNVNYILEGTYKKIEDQVRVSATLVEARKDKRIWQNEYSQPYTEIINIQADIALQIADQVKAYLTTAEQQSIQRIPTTSNEAYDLLQKAMYAGFDDSTSFTGGQGNDRLLEYTLKAIEIDPDFAEAYAYAGFLIIGSANYGGGKEMSSAGLEALKYFEKALEIDPHNGRAHTGMAMLNDWFIWDYIKADQEFQRALELMPNDPVTLTQYGEFLMKMNQLDKAAQYFSNTEISFANQYREIRREILAGNKKEYPQSINAFLNSWKEGAYIWVGEAYLWLHNYDSAYYYLDLGRSSNDWEVSVPRFQADIALACQKTGKDSLAGSIINKLIARSDTSSAMSPAFFVGWYYSGIGEPDSAFYWLEKSVKNRSPEIPFLKVDPIFDNIRNDDRYPDLYRRTGHQAYDDYIESLKE